MKHCLKEFARSNHSTFDCLVIAILSHGVEGGILGTDEGLVRIEDIINQFSGLNCPTMAGKPKLFFLQACRGGKLTIRISIHRTEHCFVCCCLLLANAKDIT